MRKITIALLFILIIPSAFAALCSDTDGGGASNKDSALKTKGSVTYGITPMIDTCLTSEEGVSTNSSKWLREYFCENDQRQNKVYDCTKYGYDRCTNGECVGSGSNQSTTTRTEEPVNACGNKRLEKDKGEQCDPPGSICFGKTSEQYGVCNPDCTCKISKSAPAAPVVCGDSERDTSEECEEDKDCPANYLCSSCKCVKQLTPEEIEAMKNKPKPQAEESDEDEDDDKTGLPEVNLSSTNFSDNAGIKATSGITSFFKKIFAWLGALFG
ncbi:hypothetical protein J4219_00490 [Candidatus Woesearchaeota archaeon]|nr:hypothetical protein [Candidatus Woesearchaeota archaeon]